jgi:D-xylulose reductase
MATDLKNPSVFLYNPGVAKIEESPYPEIKDAHDVVLRIAYVGVCGSDVMLSPMYPLISKILTLTQVHFWLHGGIIAKVSPELPLIMVLSSFSVLQFLKLRHDLCSCSFDKICY